MAHRKYLSEDLRSWGCGRSIMSTDPDTPDTRTDRDHPADVATETRDDRPDIELRSVVVEYENRPDRRTIYPAGVSGMERMSSWLTADDSVFADLESTR